MAAGAATRWMRLRGMVHRRYRDPVPDPFVATTEPLDVICPRCRSAVSQMFYGPCEPCVVELRATIGTAPLGEATAVAYEPKMNVTPNFVATKD